MLWSDQIKVELVGLCGGKKSHCTPEVKNGSGRIMMWGDLFFSSLFFAF